MSARSFANLLNKGSGISDDIIKKLDDAANKNTLKSLDDIANIVDIKLFKKSLNNTDGFKSFARDLGWSDNALKQFDNLDVSGFSFKNYGDNTGEFAIEASDEANALGRKLADSGDLSKSMDDLTDIQKKSFKENLAEIRKTIDDKIETSTDFFKRNKKIIASAVVVTAIAGVAIAVQIQVDKINNTDFVITKIEKDNNKTKISYNPPLKFSDRAEITITESNSDPNINGPQELVSNSTVDGFCSIKKTINTNGNTGKMRVKTTWGKEFADSTSTLLEDVGKGIFNVVKDFISGILKTLGINFEWAWIVLVVSCALSICISSVLSVIMLMNSSR